LIFDQPFDIAVVLGGHIELCRAKSDNDNLMVV